MPRSVLAVFLFVGCTCAVSYDYVVIFDAGSSSTRGYVYKWPQRYTDALPTTAAVSRAASDPFQTLRALSKLGVVQTAAAKEMAPGIQNFYNDTTGLESYLSPIIEYTANNVTSDGGSVSATKIHIYATAGARKLSPANQELLFQNVRSVVASSSHKFLVTNATEQMRVYPGESEAFAGWVAVNYLKNTLTNQSNTWGSLDLGGVSTQVTFWSDSETRKFSLSTNSYSLFAHSFMYKGQDEFFATVLKDSDAAPCLLLGYNTSANGRLVYGTGNASACSEQIERLLNLSSTCATCTIDGLSMPSTSTQSQWLAFSGYYFTANFFGLSSPFTISQLEAKAKQYCNLTWEQSNQTYPLVSANYRKLYCLTGTYAVALLHKAYHLPMNTSIYTANKISGTTVTWAVGSAMWLASDNEYIHVNDSSTIEKENESSVLESQLSSVSEEGKSSAVASFDHASSGGSTQAVVSSTQAEASVEGSVIVKSSFKASSTFASNSVAGSGEASSLQASSIDYVGKSSADIRNASPCRAAGPIIVVIAVFVLALF